MKRAAIVSVALLAMCACASPVIPVAADHRYFDAACSRIGTTSQEFERKKFSFSIDFSEAVITGPVDTRYGRSMEKFYSVDIRSGIRFVSDHLLRGQAPKVSILALEVEVGEGGVTAETAPIFFLKVRGRDSAGRDFSFEKGASGPAVGVFQSADKRNRKMIESANIAFLAAFLRMIVSIDAQIGESGKEPNQ
ncbi:MAG: hypothetical protein HYV95_16395 [Opitutae bacterium]|nr:hypothetical protein [Opitutae bacterium]